MSMELETGDSEVVVSREIVMPLVDGWYELMTPYAMNYKSSWNNAWFTVREFMQNALDEHDDAEIVGGPRMWKEGSTVIIEDRGRGVGVECLLMRELKQNNPKLRGVFGEGLKWACLCGLRLGMKIHIRSPHLEVVPFIARTANFGGTQESIDLMAFKWRSIQSDNGHGATTGTRVTIKNYPGPDTFETRFFPFTHIAHRFDWTRGDGVTTTIGLALNTANSLYVKDIFVRLLDQGKGDKSSLFTYNLWKVGLDPDRVQVTQNWEVAKEMSALWGHCNNIDMMDLLLDSMEYGKRWEASSNYWDEAPMDHPGVWKAAWLRRYGETALMSSHAFDVDRKASYYGMKIVVMPENFMVFLKHADIPEAIEYCEEIQEGNHEIVEEYELTPAQGVNLAGLRWILEDYERAYGFVIRVADFYPTVATTTEAQYHDGECLLRRGVLDDIWGALGVVCHELAHHTSGMHDGDPNLIFPIKDISVRMFRFIRRNRHATEWSTMVGNEEIND